MVGNAIGNIAIEEDRMRLPLLAAIVLGSSFAMTAAHGESTMTSIQTKAQKCADYARSAMKSPTTTAAGAAHNAAGGAEGSAIAGGTAAASSAEGTTLGAATGNTPQTSSYQDLYNQCMAK